MKELDIVRLKKKVTFSGYKQPPKVFELPAGTMGTIVHVYEGQPVIGPDQRFEVEFPEYKDVAFLSTDDIAIWFKDLTPEQKKQLLRDEYLKGGADPNIIESMLPDGYAPDAARDVDERLREVFDWDDEDEVEA